MLESLKQKVLDANLCLPKFGLVTFTWGNVSAIDRESGLVVIKPSGLPYEGMTAEDMVVVNLGGSVVEGKWRPSSDTPTHLEIYQAFPAIGGICHTHSEYATSWAQAGRGIPCYGTTHADYFYGEVPCLRCLTEEEIRNDYEKNTGKLIVSEFARQGLYPEAMPAVLLKNHGPFTWGPGAIEAVNTSLELEVCAKMAFFTERIDPDVKPVPKALEDKHYFRKHGKDAYYGQK